MFVDNSTFMPAKKPRHSALPAGSAERETSSKKFKMTMVKTLRRAVEWYCTVASKAYQPSFLGNDYAISEYNRYLYESQKR